MGYDVIERKDRPGSFQINGTDPRTGKRYRQNAKAHTRTLAQKEADGDFTRHWQETQLGPRSGVKPFAEAVELYIEKNDPGAIDLRRLQKISAVIGERKLQDIDQNTIDELCRKLLTPGHSAATVRRGIITPVRAIMILAAKRNWCLRPEFDIPKEPKGRIRFLLPGEAWRLVEASSPHIRVLANFLLGTGARMGEAMDLLWPEVDLSAGRAIFLDTKGGPPRIATLPPSVVAALANLPHREGHVFRTHRGQPYWNREREGGGQTKTAWKATLRRASLTDLSPHDLRHTWATWHYATHKDLMLLQAEGGWSDKTGLQMVQRYAHGVLFPKDEIPNIASFWNAVGGALAPDRLTPRWHRAIKDVENMRLSA